MIATGKSMGMEVLAERQLLARSKLTGEQVAVKAMIGRPIATDNQGDAVCPVVIEGLFGRLQNVHGIDAIDALRNAILLVEELLDGALDRYDFFWPDGEPVERD